MRGGSFQRYQHLLRIGAVLFLLSRLTTLSANTEERSISEICWWLCEFSQYSYVADKAIFPSIGDWIFINAWDNPNEVNASLLYNTKYKLAVIVFRGTKISDAGDVGQDVSMAYSFTSSNLKKASAIVSEAQSYFENKKYSPIPKIILTGHSKGGSEAAYAAITNNNAFALVFSSPGIPNELTANQVELQNKILSVKVLNIYLADDGIVGATKYFQDYLPLPNFIREDSTGIGHKHIDAPQVLKRGFLPLQRKQIDDFISRNLHANQDTSPNVNGVDRLPEKRGNIFGTWNSDNGVKLVISSDKSATLLSANGEKLKTGYVSSFSENRLSIAWTIPNAVKSITNDTSASQMTMAQVVYGPPIKSGANASGQSNVNINTETFKVTLSLENEPLLLESTMLFHRN